MSRAALVCAPTARRRRGGSVVSALVDGEPLWFSSSDAQLEPSIDAYVSALLIPAAERGERLVAEAPISSLWLRNGERRARVVDRWWGLTPAVSGPPPTAGAERRRPRLQTALCFTGGADSTHVLRAEGRRIDALLFVHGYDIPLDDAERMAHAERSVRAVGAAAGTKVVVVRTNLREHPSFAGTNWEWVHGGALAAVGHLLTRTIGRLLIASSFPYDDDSPWGSHWRLDSLWSSERLEISHVGADLWRSEKLLELAADGLAQEHLRVCWQRFAGPGANCGRCEKCVRTMLVLDQAGRLGDFRVFDQTEPLAARVSALPHIGSHLAPVYRAMLDRGLPDATAESVRSLLARSEERAAPPPEGADHPPAATESPRFHRLPPWSRGLIRRIR